MFGVNDSPSVSDETCSHRSRTATPSRSAWSATRSMFGVRVFLGSVTTPFSTQVQLPGEGLRMRADVLRSVFRRGGRLPDLLLRYTQAFIT